MFLGCQEFRYYGSGIMGQTAPYGCHCASWTVNCPFESCPIGEAFDAECLAPSVKKMGFTALSKLTNFINPASVPKALRKYTVHPDYVSTCMYWLPKPSNAGLHPVNNANYHKVLPDFGTLYFDSVTLVECADQISTEQKLHQTETNLINALGMPGLSVISISCGSMSALVTGPAEQLNAAAEKAKHPHFCWFAVSVQVCTVVPPPTIPPPAAAPVPMPGPSPGFAPAPAPAPFAFLPVLALPFGPAGVPAPSIAPVFWPIAPPPAAAPVAASPFGPAGPAGAPAPAPVR